MLGNHIPQEMIIDLSKDDNVDQGAQQDKGVGEPALNEGDRNLAQEAISKDFYGLRQQE